MDLQRVKRVIKEIGAHKEEFDMPLAEYDHALREIKYFIKRFRTTEEKLKALDYVLFVFRTEYAARARSRIFRWDIPLPISSMIPTDYVDASGAKCDSYKGIKEIKLTSDVAIAAWKPDRLEKIMPVIAKEGFTEDPGNHIAMYFTCINLAVISQGNHSASIGVFLNSGSVHAHVYDLAELFDHTFTDGREWYNEHTQESFASVADRYLALLYTIAQMKDRCGSSRECVWRESDA